MKRQTTGGAARSVRYTRGCGCEQSEMRWINTGTHD